MSDSTSPGLSRLAHWVVNAVREALTDRRTRHGIELSMFIEAAPLNKRDLWPKLEQALDLIAQHSPVWIRRMQQLDNTIHVRRIPGTRAKLINERETILDPYLLANFAAPQIASSIVHEATHAKVRAAGLAYDPNAPAREERACRRSELRFGRQLRAASVEGADAVIRRAQESLKMRDEQVGVVVDAEELRVIGLVTRLKDYPLPLWAKRRIARQWGILDTPHGRTAFESGPVK